MPSNPLNEHFLYGPLKINPAFFVLASNLLFALIRCGIINFNLLDNRPLLRLAGPFRTIWFNHTFLWKRLFPFFSQHVRGSKKGRLQLYDLLPTFLYPIWRLAAFQFRAMLSSLDLKYSFFESCCTFSKKDKFKTFSGITRTCDFMLYYLLLQKFNYCHELNTAIWFSARDLLCA